jgi:hypothetical protein
MEATLYNLRTKSEITIKGSFLKRLFSLLSWNWISFSPFPFNPEIFKNFLQKEGITSGNISYYIRVGSGIMTNIFGASSYGTLSAFENVLYFSDNNLVWKVPFSSIKNINLKGKGGIDKVVRETRIMLDFGFAGGNKHYCISVPEIASGINIPNEDNISTTQTENLYNLLHKKLAHISSDFELRDVKK